MLVINFYKNPSFKTYPKLKTFKKEPMTGLEPVTSSLPRKCSTTELHWLILFHEKPPLLILSLLFKNKKKKLGHSLRNNPN